MTLLGLALSSIGLWSAFLGGCASSPTKGLDTATASVAETRSQLRAGSEQVDAVLASLRGFLSTEAAADEEAPEPVDLTSAYKTYRSELGRLDKIAQRARARRAAMEARMNDHLVQWEMELNDINNEQARQISAQRRQELEGTLTEVGRMLDTLKDRYEPFMSDLRDIELVMANDLSVGGIRVAEHIINDAIAKAAETKNAIDAAERAMAAAIATFER